MIKERLLPDVLIRILALGIIVSSLDDALIVSESTSLSLSFILSVKRWLLVPSVKDRLLAKDRSGGVLVTVTVKL